MAVHEVTMKDGSVQRIDGTDAYHQEGSMTTFFKTASTRHLVDTWSTRVASFRTTEIVIIRRIEVCEEPIALRSA